MKVDELKKGMVLKPTWPWIGFLQGRTRPRLIFREEPVALITSPRAQRATGEIIYLGDDAQEMPWQLPAKMLVRRVLVDGIVARVYGRDFKFLEPHPEFVN